MKYLLCLLLPIGMLILSGCPGNGGNHPPATTNPSPQGNTSTIRIVPAGLNSSIQVTQTPQGGPPPTANAVHIGMVTPPGIMGLSLWKSTDGGANYIDLGRQFDNLPPTNAPITAFYQIRCVDANVLQIMPFNTPNGLFSSVFNFTFPPVGNPPMPPAPKQVSLFVEDDFYNYNP